jgi:excisionase family DNA binding protein
MDALPQELQHPELIITAKIMLTYREAAQCTSLSVATLESLVSQGKLPVVKIGKSARFRPQDLRDFAEKHLVRKNQEKAPRGANLGQNGGQSTKKRL